jgi:threonine aldolase
MSQRLFLSDNHASVHPKLWEAMRAADAPDAPYDNDALSRAIDARMTDLFGRPCHALWVATGTAANCLALATMVQPHGGVVCHREAHIEVDEGGAPGFYLHGAKLMLVDGEGALLTPNAVRAVIDSIRRDVHQVQPHALSVTQASEYGRAIRPQESRRLGRAGEGAGSRLPCRWRAVRQCGGVSGLLACRGDRRGGHAGLSASSRTAA